MRRSLRSSPSRNGWSPSRCSPGWLRRPRLLELSRRGESLDEAGAGGLMWEGLAGVSLSQPTFDLRQDVETLDGVLDSGVGWELLNRFENLLFDADGCHLQPPIVVDRRQE